MGKEHSYSFQVTLSKNSLKYLKRLQCLKGVFRADTTMSQIRYFQFQRVITLKICNTELSAKCPIFRQTCLTLKGAIWSGSTLFHHFSRWQKNIHENFNTNGHTLNFVQVTLINSYLLVIHCMLCNFTCWLSSADFFFLKIMVFKNFFS